MRVLKTHSRTMTVEIEVEVAYTITPYDPGRTSGPAERCYPPEGGEVEISNVSRVGDPTYTPFDLSPDQLAALITDIQENHDYDEGDDDPPERDEAWDREMRAADDAAIAQEMRDDF